MYQYIQNIRHGLSPWKRPQTLVDNDSEENSLLIPTFGGSKGSASDALAWCRPAPSAHIFHLILGSRGLHVVYSAIDAAPLIRGVIWALANF